MNDDLEPAVKNINSALFDAVMVGFTRVNGKKKIDAINRDIFLKDYQKFISSEEFKKSITSGTSATSSVNFRINSFYEFLKAELK